MRRLTAVWSLILAVGALAPAQADVVYLQDDAKDLLQRLRDRADLRAVRLQRTVQVAPGRTQRQVVPLPAIRCRIVGVDPGNPGATAVKRRHWSHGGWEDLVVPPYSPARILVVPLRQSEKHGRRGVAWVSERVWIDLNDVDTITHEVDSIEDLYAIFGTFTVLDAERLRSDPHGRRRICDPDDAGWRVTINRALAASRPATQPVRAPVLDEGWLVRFVRDGQFVPSDSSVFGLREAPRGPILSSGPTCDAGATVRALLTAAAVDRVGFVSAGTGLPGGSRRKGPPFRRHVQEAIRFLSGLDGKGIPSVTARARAASVGRSARAGLLKVLDDACSETVWRGPWRQGGWLPPVGRAGGRFLESVGVDPSLLAGEALTLIEEDLATWRALPNAELRALVESLVGLARPVGAGNPRANDELRRIAAATPALSLRERGRDLLVKLARVPAVHDALTETMVNGEGVQERQLCLEVLSTAGFGTPGQVARAVDILFEIALERPASPERLAGFVTDTRRRRALLREVQARQQTRRQEAVSTLAVLADLAESGSTDDERAIGEAVLQRIHQVFQSHYQGWGGEREESFFTALSRLGGGGGAPHKAAAFAMSPVEAAQFSSAQQRLAETFGGWLHRQLQEVRQELIEVKSDPTATDRADALESQVGELQTAIGELETGGK